MRGDKNFTSRDAQQNLGLEIGQHTLCRIFQAFAAGRRCVIAAPPSMHLFFAPFGARIIFVEAR